MDNNNTYGQENQNMEEQSAYGQSYRQAYSQNQNQDYNYNQSYGPSQDYSQNYNQNYNQGYNQNYGQNYNQGYNQPYQPYGNLEEPVSFGEWMLTLLIMMIPCVNIIMMFVWAFGSGAKKSKSNYFKAALVWVAISAAITLLTTMVFSAAAFPALEHIF